VSWEHAFERIGELIAPVREKYGQASIAAQTGNTSGKGFASARYMMSTC
jgi:hypothetical protein